MLHLFFLLKNIDKSTIFFVVSQKFLPYWPINWLLAKRFVKIATTKINRVAKARIYPGRGAVILQYNKLIIGTYMEQTDPPQRKNVQLRCAVAMSAVGAALLTAGFIVSPTGVIDPSVLVAFGETLTFAGALFGIDYKYRK